MCFSSGYGLVFRYDWLYDMLDFQERKVVEEALYQRIYQVAYHVIVDFRIIFLFMTVMQFVRWLQY